jgi:hypothetical protein
LQAGRHDLQLWLRESQSRDGLLHQRWCAETKVQLLEIPAAFLRVTSEGRLLHGVGLALVSVQTQSTDFKPAALS